MFLPVYIYFVYFYFLTFRALKHLEYSFFVHGVKNRSNFTFSKWLFSCLNTNFYTKTYSCPWFKILLLFYIGFLYVIRLSWSYILFQWLLFYGDRCCVFWCTDIHHCYNPCASQVIKSFLSYLMLFGLKTYKSFALMWF